jgi:hypothetical protein
MPSLLPSESALAEFRRKLGAPECETVLDAILAYAAKALAGKADCVEQLADRVGLAYLCGGREVFTLNIIRSGLRLYFHPAAGLEFSDAEDYGVQKVSMWTSSVCKATGKYRGMSAWVSDESHLAGAKRLIDRLSAG